MRPADASGSRFFRPVRLFVRSKASMRSGPASPTCIIHTKVISKRSRWRSSSLPPALWLHRGRTFAWVHYGGGQELWDAPVVNSTSSRSLCTNTGCQMGGWFNSEITSLEGFKGLRYRMAGPGAEVLRRLGAIVVTLPASEIMPALSLCDRCQRMDRPLARHGAWPAQSGGRSLLSWLPRAGRQPGGRH